MQNILRNRNTLAIRYDKNTSSLHCYYKFSKRNCYTLELLKDVEDFHNSIFTFFKNNKDNSDIKFIVYRSQVDGIFSYGGDLEFFLDKISVVVNFSTAQYQKAE